MFCAHGAGTVIPWNRVRDYMHIDTGFGKTETETPPPAPRMFRRRFDLDDRELEEILQREFGPIRRAQYAAPVRNAAPGADETERAELFHPRRERVIVDGYNVIFAWDELKTIARDNLDGARGQLMHILSNYCGYRQCRLILVFDAYKVKGQHGETEQYHNITVVYTKEAETADSYIEKAALDLSKKHKVRVATSDGMEQLIILGNGALRVSAEEFRQEVLQTETAIRAYASQLKQGKKTITEKQTPKK